LVLARKSDGSAIARAVEALAMPTRTFPGRPVLHLLAVGAGLTLLYSCAAPG
jgi:hypothetical protein